MNHKPFILMHEQDDDDRFITETFFKQHHFEMDVHFVSNNDELIVYLNSYNSIGYPSLILLNLKLPSLSAIRMLKELRSSSEYSYIPVIILSSSNEEEIIKECYVLGASSYIKKPEDLASTNKKILNFLNYWFETVELYG